jgi:hypothetical protein
MALRMAVDAAVPLQEDSSKDVGMEKITHTGSSLRVGVAVGDSVGNSVKGASVI